MKQLSAFMITIDIDRKIGTKIVRNAVTITRTIQCSERTGVIINTCGEGYRATCAVGCIQRKTQSLIDAVISDKCNIVRFIVAGRIRFTIIDQFPCIRIILSQFYSRVSIAEPAVELTT